MMKPSVLTTSIILAGYTLVCCQNPKSVQYLGQDPPGSTPVKFAPGIVSLEGQYEFGSVFSKDGREFYFGANVGRRAEIRFMEVKENVWTTPVRLIPGVEWSHNDPFLSPDEKRLYFISDRPSEKGGVDKDYDIWYLEKKSERWSEAINAGEAINSALNEYYISFTRLGTMFFASNKADNNNFDIYSSASMNGEFRNATRLGAAVNSNYYEADVFVDPDERYLIFCADRPEGQGNGDLYISFRNEDGTWGNAKNMGERINTPGHELCPFVTSDGKYFFYTSNQDIYWVDASVFNDLR